MNPIQTEQRSEGARWLVVVVFAIAMAWVEAAVVLYLRTLIGRIDPYQPNPLPEFGGLERAEMVREAATLVMLLTVGWLAGRSWRAKVGYAAVAFGMWDIFYYVFLRILTGWPHSLSDWDILFLLPLPWWGPVLAPVCIALLLIFWGTLVSRSADSRPWPWRGWRELASSSLGIGLTLYAFMVDAIRVVGQGGRAVRAVLPVSFNWPLFLVALLLMAAPVADLAWEGIARWRLAGTATGPINRRDDGD